MRVLIAYASRLGSTQAIAERMTAEFERLGIEAETQPVEHAGPDEFDAVVIGSAVYGGHWLPEARDFVRREAGTLKHQPVWLFSSGPVGATATRHTPVPPGEIAGIVATTRARDHRIFSGALDRSKIEGADLGLMMRVVAKRFVPEGDFRDWAAIEAWVDEIARELERLPILTR